MRAGMKIFKRVFSILLVCFLVFYFVPLIVEGFKPSTEKVREKISWSGIVKVMNQDMAYLAQGSGSPIILVHGFGHSTLCWERNIKALSDAGYRVFAVDLFGHGLSDKPYGRKYSLELYAVQIREFMNAQRIKKASIAGHSMGGAVAMKFAYMFPERTERLVLIGSAGVYKPDRNIIFRLLSYPLVGEFLIILNFKPVTRMILEELGFNRRIELSGDYLRRYTLPAGTRGYNYTFLRILRNFNTPEWSVEPLLDGIRHRALILHGGEDRIIPVSAAGELHKRLRNSRMLIVRDGPHSLMETHASEVNRAVIAFLSEK